MSEWVTPLLLIGVALLLVLSLIGSGGCGRYVKGPGQAPPRDEEI